MAVATMRAGGSLRARREETWEYRLFFLAGFPVFLAAAAVTRLLPGWRRRAPLAGGGGYHRPSILGEARAAANTFIPFAFMG